MARHTSSPVIVQNNATGAVSYFEQATHQSEADANGVSLADYIHAMFSFLVQAKSRDVLMIGCGGGTLATMLRRVGVAVTIVDISALSFDIAHRYFAMPADVSCHVADGAAFLRRRARRYDAIVLDAYDDGLIPAQFLTKEFLALAKSRLAPRRGLFLANIIVADDADRAPDRFVRLMGEVWTHARLLDSRGFLDRNAVAVAGAAIRLKNPTLLMPPARGAAKFAADLKIDEIPHGARMTLKKRSFSLSGHRTSVALEAEFWAVLEREAVREGLSFAAFIARIDGARGDRPLASALRVHALAAAKQ